MKKANQAATELLLSILELHELQRKLQEHSQTQITRHDPELFWLCHQVECRQIELHNLAQSSQYRHVLGAAHAMLQPTQCSNHITKLQAA